MNKTKPNALSLEWHDEEIVGEQVEQGDEGMEARAEMSCSLKQGAMDRNVSKMVDTYLKLFENILVMKISVCKDAIDASGSSRQMFRRGLGDVHSAVSHEMKMEERHTAVSP